VSKRNRTQTKPGWVTWHEKDFKQLKKHQFWRRWMKTRNVSLLMCLGMVIIIGLASRVFHTGFSLVDKYLGDALYAAMFYLILSLLWPRSSTLYRACAAMAVMTVIETFQLTQIPLQLSKSTNIVLHILAVLLGTEFRWMDMLAYLIGITAMALIDQFVLPKNFDTVRT
jgi:nicotinamide riboside transporter PnuC